MKTREERITDAGHIHAIVKKAGPSFSDFSVIAQAYGFHISFEAYVTIGEIDSAQEKLERVFDTELFFPYDSEDGNLSLRVYC